LDPFLNVNPYIAGSPVTGTDMFFGREDVFSFVRRNLIGQHRDAPIVLYGQRRTGKTSVLYQLQRHLDPRYRCIFIDLQGLSLDGMGNLMWEIASSISRGLRHDHQLIVSVPNRATFLADPRSAFETVFLDAVWSVLGEDHLVLMVDEVIRLEEEIKAGRLEYEVFDYLRHLMQHFAPLTFIFSLGSGLEEMKKEYAFLFSVSLYHRISFLEPKAARALITQPARGHYRVMPDAVKKILQITSGHPYYTQLVCHSLFDRWLRDSKPAMTAADVDAVLAEAIELGSANLTFVWQDSSPEEQAMMAGMTAAMRAGGRAVTVDQVRQAWRKVDVSMPQGEAARALQSLTAREVVAGERTYSFRVDLQRLWLGKHRRLDWVKEELADTVREWNRSAAAESGIGTGVRPSEPRRSSAGAASFSATDLARLYDFPPDLDGKGQCIGIIELSGGYRETDLEAYMAKLGLQIPEITSVSVDGALNSPGDSSVDAQATLDLEVIAAIAPRADIVIYFAPNTVQGFVNAILAATIDDIHNPSVLCIAWGQPESGWEAQAIASMNEALAKAAARSITVCCAAGDNGPTDGITDGKAHVDFPASSPYGGTRIAASESRVETEDVWNDGPSGVTGGGFSDVFPVPAWQEGIFMTNSIMSGKPPGRGLPDVAANASPLSGYQVLLDGKWIVLGGTSCVAPLWAGLIARINQGLGERVGFFNPTLYRNLGPAGILRAITDGSTNKGNKPGLGFQAGAGWDPCTGWGVPSGQRLLFALKVNAMGFRCLTGCG
jgi:hypothetical protein